MNLFELYRMLFVITDIGTERSLTYIFDSQRRRTRSLFGKNERPSLLTQ